MPYRRALIAALAFALPAPHAGAEGQRGPATIYNRSAEEILITAGSSERDKSRKLEDPAARSGWAFRADPADKPGAGLMWFGYTYTQGAGRIRGLFRLKVADNTSPNPVATIRGSINGTEIKDSSSAYRTIALKGTDFAAPNRYQEFGLDITKGEKGFGDWAVQTTGVAAVWYDGLAVEQKSRFTTDELLSLIDPPVKPAGLALATDAFRVHETYGLFMPAWRVSEAVGMVAGEFPGTERTQSHLRVHPQNTGLTGFPAKWKDLYRHAVVVLNNVPAKSVTIVGTLMLKQYVEDGGCLVMMGDTHGLVPGRWAESVLGPLLPVVPRQDADLVRFPKPGLLQPGGDAFKGLDWSERPYTIYYHGADVQPGATVLLASGETPLIVERRAGRGRVIVLLTSVCGEKDPKGDGTPFWEWRDWPALMAQVVARASPRQGAN